MSTILRSTRRGVLAIGTAAIVTSFLPRLRATEAEVSVEGVPTAHGGQRWYASTVRKALLSGDRVGA